MPDRDYHDDQALVLQRTYAIGPQFSLATSQRLAELPWIAARNDATFEKTDQAALSLPVEPAQLIARIWPELNRPGQALS
jgi:hypothetical protein